MRIVRVAVILLLFAVLLSGCLQPLSETVPEGSTGQALPSDVVAHIARRGGSFTFETVLSVALNVEVDLYRLDSWGFIVGEPRPADETDVFVFIDDSSGNRIFGGKLDDTGALHAELVLPAAPDDMTLTISADGFGQRSVVIPAMVDLSSVNRTMSMGVYVPADEPFLARQLTGLEDRDGDGVPDAYDAFPDDPNAAFEVNVPAEGSLSVAFEDLFGLANAGDADYNDFVGAYRISEVLNEAGDVVSLTVHADAVTKLAGYNHRFGIRIDSFSGPATLTGTMIDGAGNEAPLSGVVTYPAEIVLFENSRYAVGKSATFTLEFASPQVRAPDGEARPLSGPPYNPFAYIHNTGHDIHLIGREPLSGSINPADTFVDGDGFPWALLVPGNWINPDEGQRIEVPYPRFTLWRESGGEEHSDWYLHYYDPYVPPANEPVLYVAGYINDGDTDRAVYWKDFVVETLPVPAGSTASRASDIFVDGDNVYVSGWYVDPVTSNKVAAVWINGVVTALSSPDVIGEATGVYVNGGTVYVSGKTTTTDFATEDVYLWADGVPTQLSHGAPFASGSGVVVSGGVPYVSGFRNTGAAIFGAAYWNGPATVDLSGGVISEAWDIDISPAGDVYVAGDVYDNNGGASPYNYYSVYWVNDASARTTLYADTRTAGNWSSVTGIDESGGTVYTAGYYRSGGVQYAAYWANATRTNLTTGSPNDRAWDITVFDGTPIVVGTYRPSDRLEAVVWENGLAQPLPGSGIPGADSEAFGVFVAAP